MTTFVLKKYQEKTEEAPQVEKVEGEETPPPEEKQITIQVDQSISEIVAKTLHEVLGNKAIIEEIQDKEDVEVGARVITTESINSDPVAALRSVGKEQLILISNEGFHTKKEEWFLESLKNKTNNVYVTLNSFVGRINSFFEESNLES